MRDWFSIIEGVVFFTFFVREAKYCTIVAGYFLLLFGLSGLKAISWLLERWKDRMRK